MITVKQLRISNYIRYKARVEMVPAVCLAIMRELMHKSTLLSFHCIILSPRSAKVKPSKTFLCFRCLNVLLRILLRPKAFKSNLLQFGHLAQRERKTEINTSLQYNPSFHVCYGQFYCLRTAQSKLFMFASLNRFKLFMLWPVYISLGNEIYERNVEKFILLWKIYVLESKYLRSFELKSIYFQRKTYQ